MHPQTRTIEVDQALATRDLTDPAQGQHPMQSLIERAHTALAERYQIPRQIHRTHPLVSKDDHYLAAGHPPAGEALGHLVLRSGLNTGLPSLLRSLALDPPRHLLLVASGLCHRPRQPAHHELLLCRLETGQLNAIELGEFVRTTLRTALPNRDYRLLPSGRSYLKGGMQIDVRGEHGWQMLGRCGVLAAELLERCGLAPEQAGGMLIELELEPCVATTTPTVAEAAAVAVG